MLAIWKAAVDQIERGEPFVLATILSVRGSSPRHVGTRFLIRAGGETVGTIGGGLFEARVQEAARSILESKASRRMHFLFTGEDYRSTEMICGGEVEVLMEFVEPSEPGTPALFDRLLTITRERRSGYLFTEIPPGPDFEMPGSPQRLIVEPDGARTGRLSCVDAALSAMPDTRLLKPAQVLEAPGLKGPLLLEWLRPRGTVYIFGAGHVGVAVAHLAAYVDFRVVLLDDRPDLLTRDRFPEAVQAVALDGFTEAFAGLQIDEESYVVIVTRGHSHDRVVLSQALRTSAGYIGMIGSRRKNAIVFQALLAEGFNREGLQRVHAPIGLPIGGETPEEIGISIVGEMIQARSRKQQLQKTGGGSACQG